MLKIPYIQFFRCKLRDVIFLIDVNILRRYISLLILTMAPLDRSVIVLVAVVVLSSSRSIILIETLVIYQIVRFNNDAVVYLCNRPARRLMEKCDFTRITFT